MKWAASTDYTGDRPWEPKVLLPSQLAEQTRRTARPELRLLAAVLEDALQCLVGGTRGRHFLEARDWFLDDRRDWPFSFANVCEELGLDANAVRQRLLPIIRRSRSLEPVSNSGELSARTKPFLSG